MEIRPATEDDVSGVQRIARRSWTEAYEPFLGREEVEASLDEWYSRDALVTQFADPDVGFFVADDGGVVGYASAGPGDDPDDPGVLGSIYTHPDRWGDGVGSALLERADAHLADLGLARMRAVVLAENEVGVAFYERRGFDRVAGREVTLFTGGTARAHEFVRDLAAVE